MSMSAWMCNRSFRDLEIQALGLLECRHTQIRGPRIRDRRYAWVAEMIANDGASS